MAKGLFIIQKGNSNKPKGISINAEGIDFKLEGISNKAEGNSIIPKHFSKTPKRPSVRTAKTDYHSLLGRLFRLGLSQNKPLRSPI
jgi:hypothetical protein